MSVVPTKLRSWREANGLTQMDVAVKLGVLPQAVSNWERGTVHPDGPTTVKILELIGELK